MMTLRQLITGLERLSIHAATVARQQAVVPATIGRQHTLHCSRYTPAVVASYCASVNTDLMARVMLNPIRQLHTTAPLERHLDNRRQPKSMKPSTRSGRWDLLVSPYVKHEYTIKPIPTPKTGGRGPNGRIWNHKRAGGHKRHYRMIDWVRAGPDKSKDLVEVVTAIKYDPNRSARIALVAGGERQRYIIATANMKEGDVITSSRTLHEHPVIPRDGDSHPVGSLPVGTCISCVEARPDEGVAYVRAAGTTAYIVRKMGTQAVVRLPSKRELILDTRCAVTIGQVSNTTHEDRIIGKAGRNRWLGIRPRSGRWHRKEGRHGRKIKGPKKPVDKTKPVKARKQVYEMTLA